MMAAWRLRSFPVLLLFVVIVEGTNTSGGGASASRGNGGGKDRRNAANNHRRSTTPYPQESSTSPQVSMETPPLVLWPDHPIVWPDPLEVPDTDERVRHGNSVKITRRTIHGGKTKARKNGTHRGHVPVATETGFSTTGTLPLATDHVIPSDTVTASVGSDGSKRGRLNGGGKSAANTRTTAETTEQKQRTTESSISQRIHRVKTSTTPTLAAATKIAIPLSTTNKFLGRKSSTTAVPTRIVPIGGRYSNRTTSTKGEGCSSSCEMHQCETVEAEMCQGRVVKDRCNCCPVCFIEQSTDASREEVTTRKTSQHPSNACDGMQCPKHKVCILNIQGIPMCRCPNIYSCRGIERSPLCAEGETYKNKCFLKVEECTIGRRIRVDHRGSCRNKPTPTQLETSAMMWKTSRFDSDPRTQQTNSHHRKSGKNVNGDKTKSAKMRKRSGNKSQFS